MANGWVRSGVNRGWMIRGHKPETRAFVVPLWSLPARSRVLSGEEETGHMQGAVPRGL